MNKVLHVIQALPDAELKTAMGELKTLRDTTILPPGVVRQVAASLAQLGLSEAEALKVAKVELVEIAAFKWAGL